MLSMHHISKRFGATHALRDVSLSVGQGEVLALIGENGAGKSTLMKVLSGAHVPDAGTMELNGRPYRPQGPHAARLAGVAMIYQELNLAHDLSVEDNLMLGLERSRFGFLRRSEQRKLVREALETLGHSEMEPTAIVGHMSVGAQQLIEIARAILVDARVVVFDEPTSSLPKQDAERLFEVIDRLRDDGRAIVYISHYLEEVRRVADRFAVLRDGQTAGTGSISDVSDDDIVALMVGRSVEYLFPQVPHEIGEPVLNISNLTGHEKPREASLSLRRGEILGVAGLVGAGRTELLRCIFGLDKVRSGAVRVAGVQRTPNPRRQIDSGLGFVSEDRKSEGLAQSLSIIDNISMNQLPAYSTWGWIHRGRLRDRVDRWMGRLEVKAIGREQQVEALSGGNQQKVAIARVLHQDAEVLLLAEPTRGIDVGTKSQIYQLIGEAAAAGKAVLFVSSYLPELVAMCDRIAVMSNGRVRDCRDTDQWSQEEIMAQAISAEG